MVVEAGLVIEDAKSGQSNATILQQLVVLVLEKTQNLELIQATYERDMDVMRQKLNDHETTITLLSEQVEELFARLGGRAKTEPSQLVTSLTEVTGTSSQTSEEPISPGLSSSLQDVFNQLEFLNDKSNKLESISSFSDEKHSSSLHSLHFNEDDLNREVEAEENTLMKPTPILVTTLSYDTSTYNDSTNLSDYNEEEIEDIFAEEGLVTKLESTPPMTSPAEETSPPTIKSMKKKGIVTQTLVTKIPIVLQETSSDEDQREEIEKREEIEERKEIEEGIERDVELELEEEEAADVFDETSLPKMNEATKENEAASTDFKLQYPWTRSDTFDVIPVAQSSQIAVPVKPKRGVVSPLQSQRHPTERDDTITDIAQTDKAPLQRFPTENTEQSSDHSTFSQVSSNRSSSFDYEVQYIVPQVSEADSSVKTEETESVIKTIYNDKSSKSTDDETLSKITKVGGRNFNFENVEVTVKVSEASNSENEDDIITPQ
ncbi:uncharacterized protein LOC134816589 [Bolinopsis microptera]|uniref:uncharacterized protein LOC134816589 n=1 Tax=Bolinopsis microptera TaxID=2820187 RepID=UPI003079F1C9